MLLTLDVGNTNIKSGIFAEDELKDFKSHSTFAELETYLHKKNFDDIAICSVVPTKTKILLRFFYKTLHVNPFVVSIDSNFNLENNYKTPETLGIDRVCSVKGVFSILKMNNDFKKDIPVVTIDFGTATTVNVVKPPANFVGGLIAPGIKTMFEVLHDRTAQLPASSISDYKQVIGDDTNSSISSGVLNATLGLIDKTLGGLKAKYKVEEIIVFYTGGNAEILSPFLPKDFKFDRALVLRGVKSVWEINK
jgi:type III pantothenate kinase